MPHYWVRCFESKSEAEAAHQGKPVDEGEHSQEPPVKKGDSIRFHGRQWIVRRILRPPRLPPKYDGGELHCSQ
jgi:hypothetical protein